MVGIAESFSSKGTGDAVSASFSDVGKFYLGLRGPSQAASPSPMCPIVAGTCLNLKRKGLLRISAGN